MAQVQADFAFRVLDPPAASDKQYRPTVLLDRLIAAMLLTLALTASGALSWPLDEATLVASSELGEG